MFREALREMERLTKRKSAMTKMAKAMKLGPVGVGQGHDCCWFVWIRHSL